MSLKVQDNEFLLSAVKPEHYPKHTFKEVALVGRSNVGKSSMINALVNRKNFARTSNQPGRTQTINFYRVDSLVIVDLPGYGYAKVPQSVREQWKPMIEKYLTSRENLVSIIQLVDIRHRPTQDDQIMAEWIRNTGHPAIVLATKGDKVAKSKHKPSVAVVEELLQLPVIVFSAQSKLNKHQLLAYLSDIAGK